MKVIPYAWGALLAFACVACAGDEKPWYTIEPGQTYLTDFVLKPKESREITIKTNSATVVFFKTNGTFAQSKKYKSPQPVRMSQLDTDRWIGSVLGAGIEFTPVAGMIRLGIANSGEDTFKVVVVTVEKK